MSELICEASRESTVQFSGGPIPPGGLKPPKLEPDCSTGPKEMPFLPIEVTGCWNIRASLACARTAGLLLLGSSVLSQTGDEGYEVTAPWLGVLPPTGRGTSEVNSPVWSNSILEPFLRRVTALGSSPATLSSFFVFSVAMGYCGTCSTSGSGDLCHRNNSHIHSVVLDTHSLCDLSNRSVCNDRNVKNSCSVCK